MRSPRTLATAAGSFDPFDLCVRMNMPATAPADQKQLVLGHELTHYVQIVASPLGFRHLWSISSLHSLLYEVLRDSGFPRRRVDVPAVLSRDGVTTAAITRIIEQTHDVWCFVDWPQVDAVYTLDDPVVQVEWDVATATVRVGEIYQTRLGLHALLEIMAQSIEYTNRHLIAASAFGVEGGKPRAMASLTPHQREEILRRVWRGRFGPASCLYEWPLFYAMQQKILPVEAVTFYTATCAWITLYERHLYDEGGIAIGRSFLQLMDHCADNALALWEDGQRAASAGKSAYHAIEMADAICAAAGREPFSTQFRWYGETIAQMKEMASYRDGKPQSNMYWFFVDGDEVLRRCREVPATLLTLFPYSSKFGRLPYPPIHWTDQTWEPLMGGWDRINTQFLWTIQKEMLFAACTNYETIRTNVSPHNCLYGAGCVFRGSSGYRNHIAALMSNTYE